MFTLHVGGNPASRSSQYQAAKMRWWLSISLTLVITAARFGMGYFNSISGPTLLYLSQNVRSDVSAVSYMFMGRSFGVLLGAVLGGVLKIQYPHSGQLLYIGTSLGILGGTSLVVPWITNLELLVLDVLVGGIMFGFLDAGLQALILRLWGEAGSRVQIQVFHLTFSIGACIGQIVVQPFLSMSDQRSSFPPSTTCHREDRLQPENITIPMSSSKNDGEFNPIGWAYIIVAGWNGVFCIIMIYMACCNIERKLSSRSSQQGTIPERRSEEPFRDVAWVFLPMTGYFFCVVGTESVFYNFVYSVTLCSDLKFSVEDASFANSVFWVGFGAGRLTGVFAANYFSPKTIIVSSIVGSIVDSFVMVIFGEQHRWIAFIISFSHGFTPAMMYPSGVSWLSKITNISGRYMFVPNIGNSLSGVLMLRLAGYLFDNNPFTVMTQTFILAALNAFFFAFSLFAAQRHVRCLSEKDRTSQICENDETKLLASYDD